MLADASGWIEVTAGWMAAAASLLVGVILAASGLGTQKDWNRRR
jgi:hypothetical protein